MSELAKRGQSPFDDAALIQALAAPPVDEGTWFEIEPALFEQYNAYYSLDFEALKAKRAYGVFAVRQERIFAQTFTPQRKNPWPGRWFVMAITIIWGSMATWLTRFCSAT